VDCVVFCGSVIGTLLSSNVAIFAQLFVLFPASFMLRTVSLPIGTFSNDNLSMQTTWKHFVLNYSTLLSSLHRKKFQYTQNMYLQGESCWKFSSVPPTLLHIDIVICGRIILWSGSYCFSTGACTYVLTVGPLLIGHPLCSLCGSSMVRISVCMRLICTVTLNNSCLATEESSVLRPQWNSTSLYASFKVLFEVCTYVCLALALLQCQTFPSLTYKY